MAQQTAPEQESLRDVAGDFIRSLFDFEVTINGAIIVFVGFAIILAPGIRWAFKAWVAKRLKLDEKP